MNPATGLPKARTALKRAEEAEVSTLVLVWTNVSNCEGLPANRTPLVYTWDQTLGSIKKDRPCHQPSPSPRELWGDFETSAGCQLEIVYSAQT